MEKVNVELELLKEEYKRIEMEHYIITNEYIMGILTINKMNTFDNNIKAFRSKLDAFETDDDTLLEIAAMKSQIQHFITDTLEDEEVLKIAYSNQK